MPSFQELLQEFFYRPEEEVGPLFELASGWEVGTSAPAPEPVGEYLCFMLGEECYAVPIETVREILKVPPLAEVPRSAPDLLGVMNLRGEVLPVYDIKPRLSLADCPQVIAPTGGWRRGMRVVVLSSAEGDAAILVDSVLDVVRVRASAVEIPPPSLRAEREAVVGLGRVDDRLFVLLDVEQVLS